MKPNYRAAASAGLILSACANLSQGATTVQTTVGPYAASGNFDVLFSTSILSVTDLVSISDGSVFTGEGATMSIRAILADDSTVPIFSQGYSPFQTIPLSTLTGNIFTDFVAPQEVKGLRFGAVGSGAQATYTLPALTVLTFSVIPEPAVALLMLLGAVQMTFRRSRMAA